MSDELKYRRIIELAVSSPWAILPSKLAIIQDLIAFRAAGGRLTDEEIQARLGDEPKHEAASGAVRSQGSGVAVIPMLGTIIPRANIMSQYSGGTSVQGLTKQLRGALADPDVGSIVLDVDSPGGQVGGIPELAAEIYGARGQKPIIAVVNNLMASAAYWLASAADEIVVTPSGQVGSIGVLAMHEDWSAALANKGIAVTFIHAGKYKVEGNPYEPLGDEARAEIQRMVDVYYEMFTSDVARGRGVSVDQVKSDYGQGRVLDAEAAVAVGMADRVDTLDNVISSQLNSLAAGNGRGAFADVDWRRRRLRLNERL